MVTSMGTDRSRICRREATQEVATFLPDLGSHVALTLDHHEALETLPRGTVLEPRGAGRDMDTAHFDHAMATVRVGVAVSRPRRSECPTDQAARGWL